MNETVKAFREYLGDESFERFVRDLHGECERKNRLRAWQEKDWTEFCVTRGMAPWSLEQIFEVFRNEYTREYIEAAFPSYDPWQHEDLKHLDCENPPSDVQADHMGLALDRVAPFDPLTYRDAGGAVHVKASSFFFIVSDAQQMDLLLENLDEIDPALDYNDRFGLVTNALAEFGHENGVVPSE